MSDHVVLFSVVPLLVIAILVGVVILYRIHIEPLEHQCHDLKVELENFRAQTKLLFWDVQDLPPESFYGEEEEDDEDNPLLRQYDNTDYDSDNHLEELRHRAEQSRVDTGNEVHTGEVRSIPGYAEVDA